jgi:hypothetical protein
MLEMMDRHLPLILPRAAGKRNEILHTPDIFSSRCSGFSA